MTTHRSFFGFLSLLPVALVSAAACGGNAFESQGGAAGASNHGLAGSSSAGSSASTAGRGNSAGASQGTAGDRSGEAGSAIGGGGASSGGTSSGGSGGLDIAACTSNTQCIMVPKNCCLCAGTGPVANFVAINSAFQMQFSARCAAVDCASCPAPAPLGDPFYYLVPTCERPADAPGAAGHCVIVDLRATEITACKSASDCALRSGTGCCSGCGDRLVSINGSEGAALSDLVCGSEPVGCPACAPIFDDYRTTCTNGRCGVEELPCTATHPCP
ncbi:MAG TPA: hypothetical protein VER11_19385 [Polyangiaceae bacterium]|nr:hypothetical protein [Polyangiaceae bacterium]